MKNKFWVAKGLPTQRSPYSFQITSFSLMADILTAATLVEGGINAAIAAIQSENVDLRTLYQMFHHADQLCTAPSDIMMDDMNEIMDTPKNSKGVRAMFYYQCSTKYQVVARSLIFRETCKKIADYGNDPALKPTTDALASSFLLRLLTPDGILDTGKEPDLGGLTKQDDDTEYEITQGNAIEYLTFEAKDPLKNIKTMWERLMYFHASFVENEYKISPERFKLNEILLCEREAEREPDPSAKRKKREHTVTKGEKQFEVLFNSTGVIKVSQPLDEKSQRAMSLIPKELMLPNVIDKLVMGTPPEGESFVPTVEFIQKNIKVKTEEGEEITPDTPEKKKPVTKAMAQNTCLHTMTENLGTVLELIGEFNAQEKKEQGKTLERIVEMVEEERKRGREVIDLTTPQAKIEKNESPNRSETVQDKPSADKMDDESHEVEVQEEKKRKRNNIEESRDPEGEDQETKEMDEPEEDEEETKPAKRSKRIRKSVNKP